MTRITCTDCTLKDWLVLVLAACLTLAVSPALAADPLTAVGGGAGPFEELLGNILAVINAVLIPFILGIAFLFFVWGIIRYFVIGGASDDAKAKGKGLMIYATVAFVVVIIFWGIVNLLALSTGLAGDNLKSDSAVSPFKIN